MNKVVILDPALRESGGHHPATVQALSHSLAPSQSKLTVKVLSNLQLDPSFSQSLADDVVVEPFFKSDFYRFFYENPSAQQKHNYVRGLAREYQRAIEENLSAIPFSASLVFWCHTLDWLHAEALALGLQAVKLKTPDLYNKVYIVAGLMFRPAFFERASESAKLHKKMKYELAFRSLAKSTRVRFFAADFELQQYYQRLLNVPVGIQPCLLIGGGSAKPQETSASLERVILFAGDAKLNKGFAALPKLAKALLSLDTHQEFIVQYTITNSNPVLGNIEQQLLSLASAHPRLRVLNRFLEHNELLQLFSDCDAIVLNYDDQAYQQQSSGVLWLAAFYRLQLFVVGNNWLNREAQRLNMHLERCSDLNDVPNKLLGANPKRAQFNCDAHKTTKYYAALFRKTDAWLESFF